MYALFEDAGKFHAGRVMTEAESSMQIELESGKRVKVKSANVLLKFDKPQPAELIASAQTLARDIDLDLAWEFAPEQEFGFADLARDYFDAAAGVEKQAAALFRLFEAPHYFRRLGKGNFKKAPEETVKAALLGIERKKALQAQIEAWAGEIVQGQCPAPVREQLYKILFKPDKNAPEYKAVVEASRTAQEAPLALLQRAGAIASPYQFHWQRFLFDHWQYVLKELYIRHGEEHHAYLSAVSMIDDLIWSVAPKTNSDERKQLVNTLPGLLRAMHHGLDVINLSQDLRRSFFDTLVALHSAAVKAGLNGAEAAPATAAPAAESSPAPAQETQYSVNPEGELFITRISENDVQIEEVALVGASPAVVTAGDRHLQQVSALGRGDWVEFGQAEGLPTRARLSWISPQRGIFLFTNPRSPRATSISQEALAYQFRVGMAQVVTETPMFERAVHGVLESLSVN